MNEEQWDEWLKNIQIGTKVQWVTEKKTKGGNVSLTAEFGEISGFEEDKLLITPEEGENFSCYRHEIMPPELEPLKEFALRMMEVWQLNGGGEYCEE